MLISYRLIMKYYLRVVMKSEQLNQSYMSNVWKAQMYNGRSQ